MNYLLKQVRIAGSNEVCDMLISNGIIQEIASTISALPEKCTILDQRGNTVSLGWIDMFADFSDPGYEHRETIESGCRTAAAGGFTAVCTLPSTLPVADAKSVIEYQLAKSAHTLTRIYPYGTLTAEMKGKEMTELFDMKNSGAVAFTDAFKAVSDAGLVQRLLLYLKNIDGLMIQYPENASLCAGGQMNEGEVSTRLGVKGRPDLAEHIQIQRDLEITKYNNARIHFSQITSAKSLEMIALAKSNGVHVTCDVSINHLAFDDSALEEYDVNYKLLPPLRTAEDREKLIEGVINGTIDAITSSHTPHEVESKKVEFDYASFGSIGLQTFYPLLLRIFDNEKHWLDKITTTPANILRVPTGQIATGTPANLTVFNPNIQWTFNKKTNLSTSRNSPLFDTQLKGKIIAVFHNGKAHINP